jgi:flavin reductase (DIM6/NTAB) family NADH-FMN oxidoreductase RutF
MPSSPSFDSRAFRQLLGRFATRVAPARDRKGEAAGVTINSFTSVSLEPPLVLFCLSRKARTFPVFKSAPLFAVNILGAAQEPLARHFAVPHRTPLPPRHFAADVEGCPVLRGSLGWLVARKVATHPGGDHVIFVAEAIRMRVAGGAAKPLLYFRSRYGRLEG